jgi:hypothetical protein
MADPDRDENVSAAYRALSREEPPRTVDEAVLAAARRKPMRWRVPVSIAAVLALAVGVTLRMQPQGPESEAVALAPQVMQTPQPAASAPRAPAVAEAARSAPGPLREERKLAARSTPAPAPAADSERRDAVAGIRALQAPLAPEAWLARIAELRKEGRQREANESLAEFRKRYPDYKIPEALR